MDEETKKQVIALGQLGWSLRQIQKHTGVRRETAGEYLKAAGVAVRPPRGWGKEPPSKPANEVTTDPRAANPANGVTTDAVADSPTKTPTTPPTAGSVTEPYRELILNGLARGRNAMSIFQEMVDQHGFAGAYESVKRFVRKLRGPASPDPLAGIITEPGHEAQVDYGTGPSIRDPNTGKYRRSRLFVFTLGYSRKCVRLLSFQSSTRFWAELHERAFSKLGGAVKIIVLDNLGEGVLKPDIYDAKLNPVYRDVLAHYGAVAVPCRVGDPYRKRQSGKRFWSCAEDSTKRPALRKHGGSAIPPGPVGGTLGRHSHSWHDEAWPARPQRATASANSLKSCTLSKANWLCGAYKAFCHSLRSTASPAWRMPAPLRSSCKPPTIASCAAIWNAIPISRSV